jgi:hypothetical protein
MAVRTAMMYAGLDATAETGELDSVACVVSNGAVAKSFARPYDPIRTHPPAVRPVLPCNLDDRYELLAELGHGSHAIVYRAHDRELDRDVAIKVLRQELVGSDVSERFRREIRLTSKLAHPHIAHVFGTGEWLGVPYFVTELAQGPSLAERLARERQLPVEDALDIGRQIAGALAHAHAKGIIHRDVKPANILLAPDGALLADFGVARALEAVPGTLATSTGVAVGTLLYMSPEQLCADKDIDGRSDQYELALVIYEMLAGVPPHVAANAEGLRSLRIVAQHVPVHTHRSSVPPSVSDALMRAMAPSPADRFRTIADFAKALSWHESTTASRTTGTQSIASTTALTASKRRTVLVGAAIGVLALGGLGVFRWQSAPAPVRAISASGATSFAITTRDGHDAATARVANAIAMELRAWPQLRADTGRAARDGAALAIETSVSTLSDGIQVVAALPRLSDVTESPRQITMRFTSSRALQPDSLTLFAARLLMSAIVAPDSAPVLSVVTSRATDAVREFAHGAHHMLRGDLAAAEQSFATAARRGAVPQANLWRAIAGSWRTPLATTVWGEAAIAAAKDSVQLTRADALLARGLSARARDQMVDACAAFAQATTISGGSFAAWYGLGECERIDSVVVTDRRSPTGARFRTSYWSALKAYEQAIARLPSPTLVTLFAPLARVSFALNNNVRRGVAPGESGAEYAALPRVDGDSVVLLPERIGRTASSPGLTVPISYQSAIRLGRQRLLELSQNLSTQAPRSVSAQLAFSRALEYAGILTRSDGTASARGVLTALAARATTQRDSLDIGTATLRVELRLGDFASARSTALGLLLLAPAAEPATAEVLAPVAVLLGDVAAAEDLIARSARATSTNPNGLSAATAHAHAAYVVRAAVGRCAELGPRRDALINALRADVSPTELGTALERWVLAGDWMRLPCDGAPLPEVGDRGPLLAAYAALQAGDTALASLKVDSLDRMRVGLASGSIAWDTRFAEIALVRRIDKSGAATLRLSAAMNQLGASMDNVLHDVRQSGGLRRSILLCDSLAQQDDRAVVLRPCRTALKALDGGR